MIYPCIHAPILFPKGGKRLGIHLGRRWQFVKPTIAKSPRRGRQYPNFGRH